MKLKFMKKDDPDAENTTMIWKQVVEINAQEEKQKHILYTKEANKKIGVIEEAVEKQIKDTSNLGKFLKCFSCWFFQFEL